MPFPTPVNGVAVTENHTDDSSHDQLAQIAQLRSGRGILMLSPAWKLLYHDQRAWQLCRQLPCDGLHEWLPNAVVEFCTEMITALQVRNDVKDWEDFQVKRLVGHEKQSILLRGVGLPAHGGGSQSAILITMEEVGSRQERLVDQAQDNFGLTNREQIVLQQLLKGLTNKDIGMALTITEQTVKEHIKHIMAKTKTNTRTGILMRILNQGF